VRVCELRQTGEAGVREISGQRQHGVLRERLHGGKLGAQEALDLIAVHAGSLDEPGRFVPQVLTYGVRGPAWDSVDPSLQAFERMPTSQLSP